MHAFVERLARVMAIGGGVVLMALIILSGVSILGRGLNTLGHSELLIGFSRHIADALIATGVGPVNGDFELVEAGIAFAIFSFLPICQLHGNHATVDIFTARLPERVTLSIEAIWEVLLTVIIVLISWRLFAGLVDKRNYGETTLLLQFPVWWSYGASFLASLVASIVAVYCAVVSIIQALSGHRLAVVDQGVGQ